MRKWWNRKGTSLFNFGIFGYLSQVNVWIIQTLNWKIILEAKDIFSVHTCCLVSEEWAPRKFESCQTACSVVPECQLPAPRGWFVWSKVWHLRLNGHPREEGKKLIPSTFLSSYAFLWVPPFFFFFFGRITRYVMNCLLLHCVPPHALPRIPSSSLDTSLQVCLLLLDGLLLEERLDLTDLGKIISKESKLDKYLKHA